MSREFAALSLWATPPTEAHVQSTLSTGTFGPLLGPFSSTSPAPTPMGPAIVYRADVHNWLAASESEMDRVARLSDFSGSLPNRVAVRAADRVRLLAAELGFAPSRVAADTDGGVDLYFRRGEDYASISCDNDGDLVLLVRSAGAIAAEELESETLRDALLRIRDFVSAS